MITRILIPALLALTLTGCVCRQQSSLTTDTLMKQASAGPLSVAQAQLLTDNDAAFLSKLRMIQGAQSSIEMMYYIYSDDQSSSVLTKALLDATRRGVKVKLLVDYQTNYKELDLFSTMEQEGNGSLQVRFYNRPTRNIIKDAVYLTMGCSGEKTAQYSNNCSAEKFAAIDTLFAGESINGKAAAEQNISNLNVGNSGLFLSGLYAKRGDVMALAVQSGQQIDMKSLQGGASATPGQKEQLKQLGKIYWESKTGAPFQKLTTNAELFFAFALYGGQLNPIKETVTSLLPVERKFSPEERRDWDHLTDYLHHKLLLVDRRELQMGGRNVENSYHMHPNPLTSKYVFMDTDLHATLAQGGDAVGEAFDSLWNFDTMVATLADVRRHAPNDFVAAMKHAEKKCLGSGGTEGHDLCVKTELQGGGESLDERMADCRKNMDENARAYNQEYLPTLPQQPAPGFTVDSGSVLAYLENLPFNKALPPEKRQRTAGALAGEESAGGKNIHDIWLRELPTLCAAATPATPKRLVLHNAYFFPAANLIHGLSRMVNGDYDCSNVTVTVLTNSIQTTDLSVVNLAARHSLKAFTEFYQQQGNPTRRAKFDYFEYQARPDTPLSLHSKVSLFGDDIAIGSANADVRSFMMDSNNVMLLRNAPGLVKEYLAFLQPLLDDPTRTKNLNDYFATTPRDVILQEDLATFRLILAKYGVDKKLKEGEQQKIETRFVQMLGDVYELTKGSIDTAGSNRSRRENQNKFDEEFKPI